MSHLADIPHDRVLAIGDALATDVAGATRAGLDTLLVTRGIHRDELHPGGGALDRDALQRLIRQHQVAPMATLPDLAW